MLYAVISLTVTRPFDFTLLPFKRDRCTQGDLHPKKNFFKAFNITTYTLNQTQS